MRSRYFTFVRILFLGVVVFALMPPTFAYSGALEGTVLGGNNKPKPYVRIDILGPKRVVLIANNKGKFEANLDQGLYTVRVIEGRRQMDFLDVMIPESGALKRRFQTNW